MLSRKIDKMSRKFITDREVKFINDINRELIQRVVGQEIYYYAIDLEANRPHRLYRESVQKSWKPPVKVNALVLWGNPTTAVTPLGADAKYEAEVYCHTQELDERNVRPREGDFVEFGGVFFEIASVTQPQIVFGEVNEKIMTKLACVPAREGQFKAGADSAGNVDRGHPVEQTVGENR